MYCLANEYVIMSLRTVSRCHTIINKFVMSLCHTYVIVSYVKCI